MKNYYKFLFLLLFGLFIFLPDDVFARERIELSSSNGTVLWSADTIEPQEANISNVQYIIFYFDLNLTTQSNYMLDNEFIYGVYGKNPTGVDLVYLLLSGNEVAFTHSFSRLAEQYVNPFYIHKYINHINFTSNYTGFIQVQLTYRLVEPSYIGGVGITNQNLIYEGSNAPDTNETINNSTTNIITNNNTNTDKIIVNENKNHEEAEKSRKGILETLKNVPNLIIDGIKGLFIPEDMSFLENFRDSLVDKLGFIAEVPLAVFDFILNLLTASWEDFNSITLPSINIFGYNFWNETEISLQPAIDIFEPYLWVTDILCVVLCVNTLRKWYEGFAAGGGHQ